MTAFNGLGLHLGTLSRLSKAKTRSISPENFTGEPGQGGRATEGGYDLRSTAGETAGLSDRARGGFCRSVIIRSTSSARGSRRSGKGCRPVSSSNRTIPSA